MASVVRDIVRLPGAAAALGAGVRQTGGTNRPVDTIVTRDAAVLRTRINLNTIIAAITTSTVGAADAVSQKIATLPPGQWLLLGVNPNLSLITGAGCSGASVVWSLGTAAAGDADASLTSTEANIMSSNTFGDGTVVAATAELETVPVPGGGTAIAVIGNTSATADSDVYLNIAGTWTHATVAAQELTISGYLDLLLIDLQGA